METWIIYTLLAASMQAIRTAGQKKLAQHISPMAATLVRYLFGFPVAFAYLLFVIPDNTLAAFATSLSKASFIIYASLASVAQILATFWLVKVLSLRNFAVGTSFSKTEALQTAIFGMIFFGTLLSFQAWLAVFLGATGIGLLSLSGKTLQFDRASAVYGILSGVGFAFTALWLREASLSLALPFVASAAITLFYMVSIQTLICVLYIAAREPRQLRILRVHIPLATFVGVTSAIGSIGWYTAMTYENAALVRTFGQVELVFTLLITYFFFGERISKTEYLGIAAILSSVLIILLFS
jgi:drug/metabolite transporter (DMT)-like permease